MTAFLPFEAEAIRLMVGDALTASTLDEVLAVDVVESYEYTGSGYFLTVKHQELPSERRFRQRTVKVQTAPMNVVDLRGEH